MFVSACSGESGEPKELVFDDTSDPGIFDLNGEEFIIACNRNHGGAVALDPQTGDTEFGDCLIKRYSDLESKFGIDVKIRESNMSEFMILSYAGTEYASLMSEWVVNELSPCCIGMFNDLCYLDGIDITDQAKYGSASVLDTLTFGGSTYGMLAYAMGEPMPEICGYMWFDPLLVKTYAITSPFDYLDTDSWTWDAFFDCCAKVTGPSPINPDKYVWGAFVHPDVYEYFVVPMIISNGVRLVDKTENGFVSNLSDPRVYEALEWCKKLVSSGYADTVNGFGEAAAERFANHELMFLGEYSWFGVSKLSGFIWKYSTDEFSWIPYPVGPSGIPGQSSSFIARYSNMYVVPFSAEPSTAGYIISDLFEPMYTSDGLDWKDIMYAENFYDRKSFDFCMKMFYDAVPDYYSLALCWQGAKLNGALLNAVSGKESISSSLESVEDLVIDTLTENFGKLMNK